MIQTRAMRAMGRIALAALILSSAAFNPMLAQSIVFVSPSTQGLMTMACAGDSLSSFEELHYLAAAHYLADRLCAKSQVNGGVGLWRGHAEDSGLIDGCSHEQARELGALLGKYYHQKAALVFDRDPAGNALLISFSATQPLRVLSTAMAQAEVSGATVLARAHDSLIMIVAMDPQERAKAATLYSRLGGREWHDEPGNTELIGNDDRVKARQIYDGVLSHAPSEVQRLRVEMYSEQFSDLGMQDGSAH